MLLQMILEKMGFVVTIAVDGEEAVQKAKANPFDIIFMDMQMPNLNGYEATKQLRAADVRTTIIALTAYAMKGDREKCLRAGMDGYVSKPIKFNELLEQIESFYDTLDSK